MTPTEHAASLERTVDHGPYDWKHAGLVMRRAAYKLRQLERALQHYERALMAACPKGAAGEVFQHWNDARKEMEK